MHMENYQEICQRFVFIALASCWRKAFAYRTLINQSKCESKRGVCVRTLRIRHVARLWWAAEMESGKVIRPCDAIGISMIMAQNSTKHTQVITLDVHHTHTRTHTHYTVAGSSIASTAAAASACSGQLTAAATTTQVKPATGEEAE